jgi:uncharacterized protein
LKKISCPRCGADTVYGPENQWRPFCSKRCRMIDLGAWASERYRAPANDDPPGEDSAKDE